MALPPTSDVDAAIPATPPGNAGLLNSLLKTLITHVGTMPSSTTAAGTSFAPSGAIAATNVQNAIVELDSEKISSSLIGQTNGVASLDGTGKVPSAQLPSGAGVTSYNGRSGLVVPASGDYSESMITASATSSNYTPTGPTVAGHLDGVDTALSLRVLNSDTRLTNTRLLTPGSVVPNHLKTVNPQTAPYTVSAADMGTILLITSAGTVTVPSAATLGNGDLIIVNDSSGSVVVDGPGATNVTLAVNEVTTLISGNGKVRALKGTSTVIT